MQKTPYFAETERTPQQRRTSVKWAVGVAMSQGGAASPQLVVLFNRYIAGEIDLACIRAEITRMYPPQPSSDPAPTRWHPNQNAAPSRPYEPLDAPQAAELI